MRRDKISLRFRPADVGDTPVPRVVVAFDGPSDRLDEQLRSAEGEFLIADELDVSFRYTTPVDHPDGAGVFSVTDRLTGEYVLEADTDADRVESLIASARTVDDGRYVVQFEGEESREYEMRTLLVYDDDGNLRRELSLIPGGVEL